MKFAPLSPEALLSGAPAPARGPQQDEVEAALAAALQKRSDDEFEIQTELPVMEPRGEPAGEGYDFSGLGTILQLCFWLFVAALAVFAGIQLARGWQDRRERDAGADDEEAEGFAETSRLAGAEVSVDLDRVEALAQQGQFGPALHLLLLLTFRSLCDLAATELRPAWTSREVLEEIPLPPRARSALQALVGAVELSHFGGVEATAEDYALARSRFDEFVRTLKAEAKS